MSRWTAVGLLASMITMAGCTAEVGDEPEGSTADAIRGASGGQLSGLSWQTGFANADREHEADHLASDETKYLHHRTDVFASFIPHDDVDATTARIKGGTKVDNLRALTNRGVRIVQVVPLVMESDRAKVDDILDPKSKLHGQYLAMWDAFGEVFADIGARAPVVRLGHEMNLDGYPWSIAGNKQMSPEKFKALFILAGNRIKAKKPDVIRCWNPGKKSNGTNAKELWPGDDAVDTVGIDYYDNGGGDIPLIEKQKDWDDSYMTGSADDPNGIGRWYAFAKSHGKPISFPEWGLTNKGIRKGPTDRPLYIQNMRAFFQNAADEKAMMFESYYHAGPTHQLFPTIDDTRQSAKTYQALFTK